MATKNKTYQGVITSLPPNGIFVYGANTEGRHGLGAAKVAREKFGAIYGKTGLQGQSYGIITKDLGATSHPSVSVDEILKQIEYLYEFARHEPGLEFYVAYSGKGKNLNGYTPDQMAGMFASHPVPDNIVFEEEFHRLVHRYIDSIAVQFIEGYLDDGAKYTAVGDLSSILRAEF